MFCKLSTSHFRVLCLTFPLLAKIPQDSQKGSAVKDSDSVYTSFSRQCCQYYVCLFCSAKTCLKVFVFYSGSRQDRRNGSKIPENPSTYCREACYIIHYNCFRNCFMKEINSRVTNMCVVCFL